MSDEIKHGGPAFPTLGNIAFNSDWQSDDGMSLRDWFAGQALAGYFAAPNTPHQNATDCAAYMYEMADAMVAARKGGAQ